MRQAFVAVDLATLHEGTFESELLVTKRVLSRGPIRVESGVLKWLRAAPFFLMKSVSCLSVCKRAFLSSFRGCSRGRK